MRRKFYAALAAYALLAVLAAFALDEARIRAAVLVLLVALAVKTWIAEMQHRQAERERPSGEPD